MVLLSRFKILKRIGDLKDTDGQTETDRQDKETDGRTDRRTDGCDGRNGWMDGRTD